MLWLSRREALAGLAATSALPLVARPAFGAPASEAQAKALLDAIGEDFLRLSPESATSLGIDIGPRAAMRYRLGGQAAAGQPSGSAGLKARPPRAEAVDNLRLSL